MYHRQNCEQLPSKSQLSGIPAISGSVYLCVSVCLSLSVYFSHSIEKRHQITIVVSLQGYWLYYSCIWPLNNRVSNSQICFCLISQGSSHSLYMYIRARWPMWKWGNGTSGRNVTILRPGRVGVCIIEDLSGKASKHFSTSWASFLGDWVIVIVKCYYILSRTGIMLKRNRIISQK